MGLTLFGVSLLVFAMVRLIPGTVVEQLLGQAMLRYRGVLRHADCRHPIHGQAPVTTYDGATLKFRHWGVAASVALTLVTALSFLASAQAPAITVISREGRKPLPVTSINNQDYIAVDDINAAFATTSREDRLAGGLTITARGRSIVLTENQNVVSVAGRLVTLPAPPLRRDARWLVPADFLSRALSPALEVRLDLRRAARLLVVGELRVPRVVARIDAGATNVAVTFDITPNTETRVNAQPGRLVIQFDADALDLSIPLVPPQTFLLGLAPGDTPSTVVLTLGPRYATHRATTTQADAGSGRLTIELLPATTDVAAIPVPPPARRTRRW